MLPTHLNNSEGELLEKFKRSSVSGHGVNRGTPREVFVREFLARNLASSLDIGSGEIFDSSSKPAAPRPQHDVVIYKRSYPKIDLGGSVGGFLIESVVATIEVKSTLNPEDVDQAVKAGRAAKALKPSIYGGSPRPIANYVVAYRGPARMQTLFGWIQKSYKKNGLRDPTLPHHAFRNREPSSAIDGIFVLGTGFCLFENNVGLVNDWILAKQVDITWSVVNEKRGALAMLFAGLLGLLLKDAPEELNPFPYLKSFTPAKVGFGRVNGNKSDVEPKFYAMPMTE
jgi:hypothetical protein